MRAGFFARGSNNHLIIDDENPVLCQRYSGQIVVNTVPKPIFMRSRDQFDGYYWWDDHIGPTRYGYCEVTYPAPIYTDVAPLVFAVPNGAGTQALGLFCHRGGPGAWTGFSVLVTADVFLSGGSAGYYGFNSGWQYRVCTFGDPGRTRDGAKSEMGLRITNAAGVPIFDSNWPFVPFRGLLSGWTYSDATRWYDIHNNWGYGQRLVGGDVDWVLIKGYHRWGARDGTLGFLLSGVGVVPMRHDVGKRDATTAAVVLMGFAGGNRSNIWAVAVEGASQHPAGDISAISQWRLLTADFTHV